MANSRLCADGLHEWCMNRDHGECNCTCDCHGSAREAIGWDIGLTPLQTSAWLAGPGARIRGRGGFTTPADGETKHGT